MSKFDQPGKIQKLVFKLPYNLRERWRSTADDIMELQASPVELSDVVALVDREVRIITNPVFVNISESSKPPSGSGPSAASDKTSKSRKISFLSQIDGAEAKP